MKKPLRQLTVCIKGAGEMASGVALALYKANIRQIVMLETDRPTAVRRLVSFCESVYDGNQQVEGITASRICDNPSLKAAWENDRIGVAIDSQWQFPNRFAFDVIVDAILAKKNLGTERSQADLVIGLGPGFKAGRDADYVIETQRGHNLGRILSTGEAEANTGIPGEIGGYTAERVLRAPEAGAFKAIKEIGAIVDADELIGTVGNLEVKSQIAGVVRGLIRNGTEVSRGTKLGDIDPRGNPAYCDTVSEKARAIGRAVLETILGYFNR